MQTPGNSELIDENPDVDAQMDAECEAEAEQRMRESRMNWLCGCGNGGLAVPHCEIPTYCPQCEGYIGGPA